MSILLILIFVYIVGSLIIYCSINECNIFIKGKRITNSQCKILIFLLWLPILIKVILNKDTRIDLWK